MKREIMCKHFGIHPNEELEAVHKRRLYCKPMNYGCDITIASRQREFRNVLKKAFHSNRSFL